MTEKEILEISKKTKAAQQRFNRNISDLHEKALGKEQAERITKDLSTLDTGEVAAVVYGLIEVGEHTRTFAPFVCLLKQWLYMLKLNPNQHILKAR